MLIMDIWRCYKTCKYTPTLRFSLWNVTSQYLECILTEQDSLAFTSGVKTFLNDKLNPKFLHWSCPSASVWPHVLQVCEDEEAWTGHGSTLYLAVNSLMCEKGKWNILPPLLIKIETEGIYTHTHVHHHLEVASIRQNLDFGIHTSPLKSMLLS